MDRDEIRERVLATCSPWTRAVGWFGRWKMPGEAVLDMNGIEARMFALLCWEAER